MAAENRVFLLFEATGAMRPHWLAARSLVETIIRGLCAKQPTVAIDIVLLLLYDPVDSKDCLVKIGGHWTNCEDCFNAIAVIVDTDFNGASGFAAITNGLDIVSELCTTPAWVPGRHCILVAASAPQDEQLASSSARRLSSRASLSVICPSSLPVFKTIYNMGKLDQLEDDYTLSPDARTKWLVLISKELKEACFEANFSILAPEDTADWERVDTLEDDPSNLPTMEVTNASFLNEFATEPPKQIILRALQAIYAPREASSSNQASLWIGNLSFIEQGQEVVITKLQVSRSAETAASPSHDDWPTTMLVDMIVSENKLNEWLLSEYVDLCCTASREHEYLKEMQQEKSCAVIKLPSQVLLLYPSDVANQFVGRIFDKDVTLLKEWPSEPLPNLLTLPGLEDWFDANLLTLPGIEDS